MILLFQLTVAGTLSFSVEFKDFRGKLDELAEQVSFLQSPKFSFDSLAFGVVLLRSPAKGEGKKASVTL